jgi:hypothetical protein
MTKMIRQQKFKDPKTIYISWFQGTPEYEKWVKEFCMKVRAGTNTADSEESAREARIRCITPADAFEPGAFRDSDELLEGITDIVAVLTNQYIVENQNAANPPQQREFARFIARRLEDEGDSGCKRAWVAPLQKFTFRRVMLSGIRLSDDHFWLVRLKDDGQRFAVPPEPIDDDIYAAVEKILDELEGG